MLRYKDTILVVHPSGGYGRFLAWCLAYFSGGFEKCAKVPQRNHVTYSRPMPEGTIHFDSSNCDNSQETVKYLTGNDEFKFGSTVGYFDTIQKHQSYIPNYQPFFKKIVLLTQDPSCQLLILHNKLEYLAAEQKSAFFDTIIDQHKKAFAAHNPVPIWQLREMISVHYCLQFVPGWYQPVVGDNVINISVRHLIHQFQDTIIELLQQLDLPLVHGDQIERISTEWLSTQQFTNVDYLCQDIVAATLEGSDVAWHADQLTIIDEAFIQFQLRNKNFEMRCYGLDTFPTNSVQLKELLYPV